MSDGNGRKWFSGMSQILVGGLLVAAVGGSVWTAVEVRSMSVKLDTMTDRLNRHDARINVNSARIRTLEQNPSDVNLWSVR